MDYEICDVVAEAFTCDPKYFPDEIAFALHWDTKDIGFGQLICYYNTKTEKWEFDNENMPPQFCADVLAFWIKKEMTRSVSQ